MGTRAMVFAGLERHKLSEGKVTSRGLGFARTEEERKKRQQRRRKGKVQPHVVVMGYRVEVVIEWSHDRARTWGQERRVWSTVHQEFVLQGQQWELCTQKYEP